MNNVELVKLSLEIAKVLSSRTLYEIDFILESFGFITLQSFNGDEYSYILDAIKNQPKDKLTDLGIFLGILSSINENSEPENSQWPQRRLKIFISHTANNREKARAIQSVLETYYISSFIADTDISASQEWRLEIEKAISSCNALLALMTPEFKTSEWTDQETGYALGKGKVVIPVNFGINPYGLIGIYQAIDGNSKTAVAIAEEIVIALSLNNKTRLLVTEAIVNKFEDSQSYDESKSNVSLLEKMRYFDDSLLDRLEKSVQRNSQNAYARGVPERIERIIAKYSSNRKTLLIDAN